MSTPLTDALEALIDQGLTFSECHEVFARRRTDEEIVFVSAAQDHRLLDDGVLEVDENAIVSESDEGAYVMAWLWIDKEDTE